jgi:hypothetical protein
MIANSRLEIGYRLVQVSAGSRLSFEFETDRLHRVLRNMSMAMP